MSPSEIVPVVPERLAALANRVAPPSNPSPQVASILPGASMTPAYTAPPPGAVPALAATALAAPASVVPPPVAAAAPVAAPAAGDSRVVLRLKSDAWIKVRERQGQVLLNRVMRGGETWPVPKGAQLLLTTGNAGGTELLVDGRSAPPLGAVGAVRRDVALEPDGLKAQMR